MFNPLVRTYIGTDGNIYSFTYKIGTNIVLGGRKTNDNRCKI